MHGKKLIIILLVSAAMTAMAIPSAFAESGAAIKVVVKNVEQIDAEDESSYTKDDVAELARIIYWEARGESADGRLAVANVVINRTKNDAFPGTIKKVVSQSGQFSPYQRSDYYKVTVPDEYYGVAEMALAGDSVVDESVLWFRSDAKPKKWYDAVYAVSIGNHHFYSL